MLRWLLASELPQKWAFWLHSKETTPKSLSPVPGTSPDSSPPPPQCTNAACSGSARFAQKILQNESVMRRTISRDHPQCYCYLFSHYWTPTVCPELGQEVAVCKECMRRGCRPGWSSLSLCPPCVRPAQFMRLGVCWWISKTAKGGERRETQEGKSLPFFSHLTASLFRGCCSVM